jgi:mannose-6-phosphate isomerase-like protein (cupin superfamily)
VGAHTTKEREEILVVLKGTATVIEGTAVKEIPEGRVHYIKEDVLHDVKNNGSGPLEYVFVVNPESGVTVFKKTKK